MTSVDTIRNFGHTYWDLSDDYPRTEMDNEKIMDYQQHYLNWPKHHAPTFLQGMLDNYLNGRWAPMVRIAMVEQLPEDAVSCATRLLNMPTNLSPGLAGDSSNIVGRVQVAWRRLQRRGMEERRQKHH